MQAVEKLWSDVGAVLRSVGLPASEHIAIPPICCGHIDMRTQAEQLSALRSATLLDNPTLRSVVAGK
jgi:hypothetical protein